MDNNVMLLGLEEKIDKSKCIIAEALSRYNITVVAYTGGKDSTLMLWIIKEVCREQNIEMPEAMFINEGDVFEEIKEFANYVTKIWNVKLVEVKNDDVLKQVKNVGEIVVVNKLDDINRRELERLSFHGKSFVFEPESYIGNHLMKTVAMNNFIMQNSIDAVFTGIRWDEQDARKNEVYFSPRENPEHVRVHPILHFTERDVWNVIKKYSMPVNALYMQGYRSLGAKKTTTKVSDRPAWEQDLENIPERSGRHQDKEGIMKRLRDLGYM